MLHLPLFSFFSKKLYRDVGQNWKGANFAYLFLLLAVCWIAPTLSMREKLVQSLNSTQLQLINQLPDIHIKNGRVELDQTKPLNIKLSDETVAIIDTTGSMNYIADDKVVALLTADKLILRRGQNQFNTLSLSEVTDFHVNKEIASQWLQSAKTAIAPLSYGIFLLLSYIFTVLLMIFAAVIGLILSSVMHSSLKFSGILRIAATAVTPAIILIAISAAYQLSIPGLIYAGITALYLLIGIIACRKPSEIKDVPQLNLSALLHDDDAVDSHAA